jgi:hypothetical protein
VDLYSRRQRKSQGEASQDVFSYDVIPVTLRTQIQQILVDAIGPHYSQDPYFSSSVRHNPDAWEFIAKTLRREFGVHRLSSGSKTAGDEVFLFLAQASCDQFIDTVELCVRYLDRVACDWAPYHAELFGVEQSPEKAIEEINARFLQAGVGYQFENGEAIRIDQRHMHSEVTLPAITLLRNRPEYAGPEEEYMKAHRHYRDGEYVEAITYAGRAFESFLKSICEINAWQYAKGSRASDLLKIVRSKGLWPEYLDPSFDQLLATLRSSLPEVRNNEGAHGQGSERKKVPSFLAAYALHLAAAKIILIDSASQQVE